MGFVSQPYKEEWLHVVEYILAKHVVEYIIGKQEIFHVTRIYIHSSEEKQMLL